MHKYKNTTKLATFFPQVIIDIIVDRPASPLSLYLPRHLATAFTHFCTVGGDTRHTPNPNTLLLILLIKLCTNKRLNEDHKVYYTYFVSSLLVTGVSHKTVHSTKENVYSIELLAIYWPFVQQLGSCRRFARGTHLLASLSLTGIGPLTDVNAH